MRKRWLGTAIVLQALFLAQGRQARANDYLLFKGGPMKNLYVDVVFWGNFQDDERQTMRELVARLSGWLNGGSDSLPGLEPAVHWYGVSGITPGMWLNDTDPIPTSAMLPNTGHLNDGNFQPVVTAAQNGTLGPAFDYGGNVASSSGLPADGNRLTLVVTKGTTYYCIPGGSSCIYYGYHSGMSGHPYAALRFESREPGLSHEVMEAMTDPLPFTGWDEVADACEGVTGGDTFAWLDVDPAFAGPTGSFGQTSCQKRVPEQHAPMAAAVETISGVQKIFLYYVASNGHVNRLQWNGAGQAASSPTDFGLPSQSAKAVGKPSVVYLPTSLGASLGEYLFVKGSDNAVWMLHDGAWTSLGGQIYGEPQAVFWSWNNQFWIHVAALGLDDRLYVNGIKDGVSQFGWGQVPSGTTLFAGSPTIVNRAVNALDIFAPAEDGSLKWVAFQDASGWAAPVTVSAAGNGPYLATASVVSRPPNAALVGVTQFGLFETSWSGSAWYSMQNSPFPLNTPDSYSGFQGTPAMVSSTTGRYDMFSVSRNGKLFWWYSTNQTAYYNTWVDGTPGSQYSDPLVTGGVSGDPVAVSRSASQVEMFYRTTNGALTHMTYNIGGSWTTERVFGSIGGGILYDPPTAGGTVTRCSPGGHSMHCCPSGYAMIGADTGSNVFKCAPLDNATGSTTLDTGTVRNAMHVCPTGQVMVGLDVSNNLLACQALPANSVTAEWVDSGTLDPSGVHVCDDLFPTSAMSGIDAGNNLIGCASLTQMQ